MKKIISVNDDLYLIKGTVSVNTNYSTDELKVQYRADAVLRRGNEWYLVSKVIDADWEDL